MPAMPHLDFHDHREERKTPADFHDFARAASSGCGDRPSVRRIAAVVVVISEAVYLLKDIAVVRQLSLGWMDGVGDRRRGGRQERGNPQCPWSEPPAADLDIHPRLVLWASKGQIQKPAAAVL